ncbi:MAG TPA: sulfotransferase [Polyangiales bacterium]|nr:sulfotransferase [Polyangiales bacterium]
MLRLAWSEPRLRPRLTALFVALVFIPLYSGVTAAFYLLDELSPSLRRVRIEKPVFVVGHARSGTTLLHRLMVSDSEHFSFFLLYELLFPSLLQKRILRSIGAIDRKLFRSFFTQKLIAAEDEALEGARDMHHLGLFVPEEDDFVLTASCVSSTWVALFPGMPEFDVYYVDDWPEKRRRRVMRAYADGVRRQLCLSGPHKIHCSKNPSYSGRIESLIEQFPDARFVVMMRDPREAIPSLLKMLQKTWYSQGWSEARIERSIEALIANSVHTYLYPLEVLDRHPETKWTVVDYRELVSHPKATVEAVYAALDLEMTPAVASALDAEQRRARAHQSSHDYGLEEFGIDEEQLKRDLRQLFDRFHWDTSPKEQQSLHTRSEHG